MESEKKYRDLMEKEILLRTEKDHRQQEDEILKVRQGHIDEQNKIIYDLKDQMSKIKKVNRTRNLFLALGVIVIIILANVLLGIYFDKVLTREIDKYQMEIENEELMMEEQLEQMQMDAAYTE